MRFRSSLVSKPLTQSVASGSGQDVFVLDNTFALIDAYIYANRYVSEASLRLQKRSGPYISRRDVLQHQLVQAQLSY
jgi:hypothetical protein